jgi:heterodisulfide reductase subunit D
MTQKKPIEVPVMAAQYAKGHKPEYLFWVGCAGAFDKRYREVTRAFAEILNMLSVDYAVLGTEETCNGDPARRAGNEMLFHMQAAQVIETLNRYEVERIICICPHCYNIFKNEYPELGGNYEIIHYTRFLARQLETGKLNPDKLKLAGQTVTFHDPCYLGRGNNEYDAPREIIDRLGLKRVEMTRSRSFSFCCGAGGAQMFKEAEKGTKEVFMERTEEALNLNTDLIATSCPFCMTMISDGLKYKNVEKTSNKDIAEILLEACR